jgi:hypothetical protein
MLKITTLQEYTLPDDNVACTGTLLIMFKQEYKLRINDFFELLTSFSNLYANAEVAVAKVKEVRPTKIIDYIVLYINMTKLERRKLRRLLLPYAVQIAFHPGKKVNTPQAHDYRTDEYDAQDIL